MFDRVELYERNGSSKRLAMTAADYDQLARMLAEKSGLRIDDEPVPELEWFVDE